MSLLCWVTVEELEHFLGLDKALEFSPNQVKTVEKGKDPDDS